MIAASGLPAALAAKAATSTIPIVFRLAVDPVAFGLAESLDRLGGNITGVTILFDALIPKKFQLLHALVPQLHQLGFWLIQTIKILLLTRSTRSVRQQRWAFTSAF